MKIYTESEVRTLLNEILMLSSSVEDAMDLLTPIEIPSDEEIGNKDPYRLGGGNYNGSAGHKWQKGARWMRDLIQGGNK